jgi:oxygen-independent coproporphyrinogen III oxidase
MVIDKTLLNKYNQSGPRYTSYPPATFFISSFGDEQYRNQVALSNTETPNNISLYVHIPFCKKLCHFCGCNSMTISKSSIVEKYIDALCKEIKMVAENIDKSRKVTQIHWGGGTPNIISISKISKIINTIYNNFKIADNAEIAIECNPAYSDFEYYSQLRKLGFNRVSLGVQDFDNEILNIVNRDSSLIPYNQLIEHLKKEQFSINIDLIYGLPKQTIDSFEKNLYEIIKLQPNRLVTFSYAHVPWVKKAQTVLEKYNLPNADIKLLMLENANKILQNNEYVGIGIDHFSQPTDELAIALKNKQLHRNFQGYCTKQTTGQVYAFGISGITQLSKSYFQNTKNIDLYIKSISDNRFAVEKEYLLDELDIIVREVIVELMCNRFIDFVFIANKYGVSTNELFKLLNVDFEKIKDFEDDDLIDFSNNCISVKPKGTFFIRNIAMVLDPKLKQVNSIYSKTI